ncbi:uncharacterized protein LOC119463611 [Dermacentor silvarum]|uniref:uncharacterized protein LOC119463611 n=1 Tax=Dermacentor silvarum TaxID=543639 RepID=UPI0021018EB1|nr:uncharacterized protein LOC119463611 [Dermacentor silvarum]
MVFVTFRPFGLEALLELLLFLFFAAECLPVVSARRMSTCSLNTEICGQGYPTSRVLSWEVCSERSTAMDGVSGDEFHYRCHVLLRGSPDRGTFANRGKLFVQQWHVPCVD